MRWAKDIKAKKWGVDIIVRVHLRIVHSREPTMQEVIEVLEDGAALKRIASVVSEEQIINAFSSGDEVPFFLYLVYGPQQLSADPQILGVYCMKCVAYDAEWQQFLVTHYPPWEEEYKRKVARKRKRKPVASGREDPPDRKPAKDSENNTIANDDLSDLSELETVDDNPEVVELPSTEGSTIKPTKRARKPSQKRANGV